MIQPIRFEPAALPPGTFHVASLRGEEAVSRPYRFDLDLVSADPDLPLDDILGRAAVLWLGDRRIDGIVAEIDQGDAAAGGFRYRAVLAPRLWLASLGVRSRMFQGLSAPDMALAALGEVGVRAELRLARGHAPESHAVQYRESTLDFVSRQLAAAGIAYHFEHGDGGERVILTDDNSGFHGRAAASLGGEAGAVALLSLGCRRRLAPRAVLFHNDSLDPDAPLEAQATVDERGIGLHVEHASGLVTPERVAATAELAAGALRAESTRYSGLAKHPVHAGQVLEVSGHFRRDMNRRYLVVEARHTLEDGEPRTTFEAIAADVPYRTRPLPKPRVEGFVEARVDAPPDGGADANGHYRVRLPFDLGAPGEGRGSPPLPQVAPGGGVRFPMKGGTPVMVGFLEGDPDRPVIAGAASGAPRAGGRGAPGRVVLETSAPAGAPSRSSNTRIQGSLPEERPLAESAGTSTYGAESTGGAEWMRFAVPQGGGKWSYLRYGDVPSTHVSTTEGTTTYTFTEAVLDGDFTSAHINDSGNTTTSGGFTFKLDDLNVPATYSMVDEDDTKNSPAGSAYFKSANSQGVFDYTDGNRTVITQGDSQSITAGHRTDVILGDYRVVIPKRTQGVYDADEYHVRFREEAGSWRKTEVSHVKSNTVSYGDSESLSLGFRADLTMGTNVGASVGLGIKHTLGFDIDIAAGYRLNFDLGHSWAMALGKNISNAESQSLQATEDISIQIPSSTGFADKWVYGAGVALCAGVGLVLAEGALEFTSTPDSTTRFSVLGAAGAAFLAAVIMGHITSQKKPTEEDPSIYLSKEKIELSIGTSSITLTKDSITLETGAKDSVIEITQKEVGFASGKQGLLVSSELGGISMQGDAVLVDTPDFFIDGQFECAKAAKAAGGVLQVQE